MAEMPKAKATGVPIATQNAKTASSRKSPKDQTLFNVIGARVTPHEMTDQMADCEDEDHPAADRQR